MTDKIMTKDQVEAWYDGRETTEPVPAVNLAATCLALYEENAMLRDLLLEAVSCLDGWPKLTKKIRRAMVDGSKETQ
jgi:hypothetical protein